MSDRERLFGSLGALLTRLRARQRQRNVLLLMGRCLFWGCVAAVVLAALTAISPIENAAQLRWWALAAIPLGALVGVLLGLLGRIDDLRLARAMDAAAASEDRFASALQLAGHPRAERAQLVAADALAHVSRANHAAALPLRSPRELWWLPAPLLALVLVFWLVPVWRPTVLAAQSPEISADEWSQLHQELQKELAEFPRETPEDRELAERLDKLAEMLREQPDKKDALAEIARLRDELEKRAAAQGSDSMSLRQAARSIQSSSSLGQFAALLQAGEYEGAAAEKEKLAEQLEADKDALTADEYESVAQDMERLAEETKANAELSQACQSAAAAAGKLNRAELSKSCRNLSNTLRKNASKLRRGDGQCRSRSMLDRLSQKLGKCKGGKCGKCGNGKCNGDCDGEGEAAFVMRNNKKGGLKAGWGSADKWKGGKLDKGAEERQGAEEEVAEGAGDLSVVPTVSNDERANSAQQVREAFANMIRKAEADLDLENVPLSHREFLRRYFVSIKPAERADGAKPEKPAAPSNE
ncbi:MAG: hypothetical protein HZB38_00220 [Planctomycetes bacterium]|nr:hypothetical protein [Planctomycetota bacterium]